MTTFLRIAMFACLVAGATACLDTTATDDSTDPTAPTDDLGSGFVARMDQRAAQSTRATDDVPAVFAPATKNCGEMTYCDTPGLGYPSYHCFKGNTCTVAQQYDDYTADCAYVCGKSACKTLLVNGCIFP